MIEFEKKIKHQTMLKRTDRFVNKLEKKERNRICRFKALNKRKKIVIKKKYYRKMVEL